MSLKSQIKNLQPGESFITKNTRTGIYVAAKRAGVEILTGVVDTGIKVTRKTTCKKTEPVSLAERVAELSPKDRLELFERFELCCGMNRGECVCDCTAESSVYIEGVTAFHNEMDDRQAKLAALREMMANPQPEPEPIEDVWKFVPGVQHFGETDQYYRGQVCGKRKRTVEVDGSDYERILRVV